MPSNTTAQSAVGDWLIREILLHQPGHDEPAPGVWACGECPYFNVGQFCTKCGAPQGTAWLWQDPISPSADRSTGVDSVAPEIGAATRQRPAPRQHRLEL